MNTHQPTNLKFSTITERDLELLMAWRSHPDAYAFFKKQDAPLKWENHYNFWINRVNRNDFFVNYKENNKWRKVGHISFTRLNTKLPEIGILIGELTLHGKGVGTNIIKLALEWLKDHGYTQAQAVINVTNIPSKKIFEKNGFTLTNEPTNEVWKQYICKF